MMADSSMTELDLIKKECSDMIETLKQLHREENELREQNEILAQQAVLAGSRGEIEKRGKKKTASSSPSQDAATKKVMAAMPVVADTPDLSQDSQDLFHQLRVNSFPKP
jgi:cell shape-determining protein MreC